MAQKKFVIIDGHALIYRGYYALPPLSTKKGELVNAVYGFTTILLNMLQKLRPDYLAVSFDLKGPTFRHEAYEDYKATRKETPDDLISQVPRIRQVVGAFQIPVFEKEGFEADDCIATLAKKIENYPEVDLLILTGDMDLTQLVNEQVKVLSPLTGFNEVKTYDADAVVEKYGVRPDQMVDYKALVGDTSDNILGVQGVGKKTAAKLLQEYETLEGIFEHLDEIKGALHDKLEFGEDVAMKSKELVQLRFDAPMDFDLEACTTHEVDGTQIRLLFGELEFSRLIQKFEDLQDMWQKENQTTLF